jgi:ABC-type multidrug transport system ATPase subunit
VKQRQGRAQVVFSGLSIAVTRHDVLQLMVDEVAERETSILITSHRLEDIERLIFKATFSSNAIWIFMYSSFISSKSITFVS